MSRLLPSFSSAIDGDAVLYPLRDLGSSGHLFSASTGGRVDTGSAGPTCGGDNFRHPLPRPGDNFWHFAGKTLFGTGSGAE